MPFVSSYTALYLIKLFPVNASIFFFSLPRAAYTLPSFPTEIFVPSLHFPAVFFADFESKRAMKALPESFFMLIVASAT